MNIEVAQQSPQDSQPNLRDAILATLRDELFFMFQKPIQDEIQQLRGDVERIQGDVQQIQKDVVAELRYTRRFAARTWNNDAAPGDTATFEIVPFLNLEDPITAPHNLPPLNSPTAIRELEYHHMRRTFKATTRTFMSSLCTGMNALK